MTERKAKKSEKSEIVMEKQPEVKEPLPPYVSREEQPAKIKFNEFLNSISKSREFLPETIGGFVSWMRREGIPKSLSFDRWKELLVEYSQRKV